MAASGIEAVSLSQPFTIAQYSTPEFHPLFAFSLSIPSR